MKTGLFNGIGAMAFALTLAIVGVDAFTHQVQGAETKVDQKLQDCAKACEAFPDDKHMKACADECRRCEKACKAVAK